MPERLQLLTDPNQIHEAFSIWRNAMEQHGLERGNLRWLPEANILFRFDGKNSVLGLDTAGKNATVELNEPAQHGTENPLSASHEIELGVPI